MHILFECPDARLQGARDLFLDTFLTVVMPDDRALVSSCLVPTAFLDLLMSEEFRKHKHGPCLVCTRHDIFDIVQSVPIPVLDDLSIVYLLLSWYAMDWYRSC